MKTKRWVYSCRCSYCFLFSDTCFYILHQIEAVLGSHTTGQNKIAEKGAIIIRIINYALSLSDNDEQTQFRLYTLGKAHAKRKIRPYMYSIFVQVMLYTISAQLGTHASQEGTWHLVISRTYRNPHDMISRCDHFLQWWKRGSTSSHSSWNPCYPWRSKVNKTCYYSYSP